MPRKEFGVYDAAGEDDPVIAVLGDEEFAFMNVFPAASLLDDEGEGNDRRSTSLQFLERALLDDQDIPRLRRVVLNRKKVVSVKVLADVMNWVLEIQTARPTEKPARSSPSPRARGAISAVD